MFKKELPKSIKLLYISHFIHWGGVGLIAPMMSFFYGTKLEGVSLTEIGIGALIYYLMVGFMEPVVGFFEDKLKGLRDETFITAAGYFLRGFSFCIFGLFAINVWHYYVFQFVTGLARALYNSSDKTIFTHIVPKHQMARLWGTDDSIITLAGAFSALIGGYLADTYSLRFVIIISGIIMMASGFLFLGISDELKKNKIWKGY